MHLKGIKLTEYVLKVFESVLEKMIRDILNKN